MLGRQPLAPVEAAIRDGELTRDPHSVYRQLRESAPVYWCHTLRQWLVTTYDAAEEVLLDPHRYSSYGFDTAYIRRLDHDVLDRVPTLRHHFEQRGLIQADPPEHGRLRRALRPGFTNAAVQSLEGRIRTAVDRLLAQIDGTFELVADVAGPLPVTVIADLLGVPEDRRAGFPRWSQDAVRFFGSTTPETEHALRLEATLVEWRALVKDLIETRRSAPQEDVLTLLARGVESGQITEEEAIFTCVHLLIAGHETTTSLVTNTLFHLISRPELYEAVAADPWLVGDAVEETLRFEPPIQRVRRAATSDTNLRGAEIAAGEAVIVVLSSANRDAAVFSDPDSYTLNRDFDRPHFAFGRGVHFCLGAPLARLEAPIAIEALTSRFPRLEFAPGYEPRWIPTINLRRVSELPLVALSS